MDKRKPRLIIPNVNIKSAFSIIGKIYRNKIILSILSFHNQNPYKSFAGDLR